VTYGILDANKDEMKVDGRNRRTSDYARAYAMWQKLYPVMICFLVRWECEGVFTVLEPSK
jgi:hypothetical protein